MWWRRWATRCHLGGDGDGYCTSGVAVVDVVGAAGAWPGTGRVDSDGIWQAASDGDATF